MSWYDSKWPDASGTFVFVDSLNAPHEGLVELVEATSGVVGVERKHDPEKIFLFWGHPITTFRRFTKRWDPHNYAPGTPPNVWLGLPIDGETSPADIFHLYRLYAHRRFVDMIVEPSPEVLEAVFFPWRCPVCGHKVYQATARVCMSCRTPTPPEPILDWLIDSTNIVPSPFADVGAFFGVTTWPSRPPPV